MGKSDVLWKEWNFLMGEYWVFMTRSLGLKICPFVLCFVLFFLVFFSASKQRAVCSDNPHGGFISSVFFLFTFYFLLFLCVLFSDSHFGPQSTVYSFLKWKLEVCIWRFHFFGLFSFFFSSLHLGSYFLQEKREKEKKCVY